MDVLVVSEDHHFIEAVHGIVREGGGRSAGCLGPANTPCDLETRRICPLAAHSSVVLVDAPASGSFRYGAGVVPAGEYAERRAEFHPGRLGLLSGARPGAVGAAGEVAHVADRLQAVATIQALLDIEAR